jgi:hypothetical protein
MPVNTRAGVANRDAATPGRRGLALAVLMIALLGSPACSRITNHFSHHTVTRTGTLVVSPANGPPGTAFSLTAGGFKPGEAMTFEVDLPNHTRFVGPSHTAGPDGKVSSTYTALTGDPAGVYVVKATGALGTRAQGNIQLTGTTPSSAPH